MPISDQPGLTVFQTVAAIGIGAQDLTGAVTPASVIAAMKSMKNSVLPASGGRVFRCNGKATSEAPAICSVSTITGTLDASGNPLIIGWTTTVRSPAEPAMKDGYRPGNPAP